MSSVELYNKGQRRITTVAGLLSPNTSRVLDKEEADKLMAMFPGELITLQEAVTVTVDDSRVVDLEQKIVDLEAEIVELKSGNKAQIKEELKLAQKRIVELEDAAKVAEERIEQLKEATPST